MNRKLMSVVVCAAFAPGVVSGVAADFEKPVIKEWIDKETAADGKIRETKYMSIDGIIVHEEDPAKQPQPPVVAPGRESTQDKAGSAPADAVVLFDGTDLSKWISTDGQTPTKWEMKDGAMRPTRGSGMIQSRQEFGSCQLHLEFATPAEVKGSGQGRGNSGVFLMGQYEIQVLDSYENTTYPDGQAGALYGRSKPLVNASRKPGEWQSFDIVFHRPVFENGKVMKRATFTVFHNGVLIQDNIQLSGGTGWNGRHSISSYVPHGDKGPLKLQDHGNPVLFRNIWVRELKD